MSLFADRLAQARQGETALVAEMDRWKRRANDDEKWHRHHSQLSRLSATVDGLLAAARMVLEDIKDDAAGWSALLRFERALLAVNRIWDHFRAKYLIRLDDQLGLMLRLADDFAWACYKPVQDALTPDWKREPTLVYFSETWSPFALARDRSFANEMRIPEMATAEILLDDAFEEALAKLPVPLVSLPWFQASHTPSMLIIAHEMGHIVSADFGLGEKLRSAIDEAKWEAGADCWQRWREELFADLFGVLVGRDGFVGTLIVLLATDPKRVTTDHALAGIYPPRSLRMEIALHALARLDGADAAADLRKRWETNYGDSTRFAEHLSDIPQLLDLIMGLPCGNHRLDALFKIDPQNVIDLSKSAVGNGQLGKSYFDVTAALVLAQRIDGGRRPDLTEEEKANALGRIPNFVDQRKTGYLSSSGDDKKPIAKIEDDTRRGAGLWKLLDKD